MNEPLVIFDVFNLAYRAFHVLGGLSFGEVESGISFGILRDIIDLRSYFSTDSFAFAFDAGKPKRKLIYSAYKENRRKKENEDPEAAKARQSVRSQVAFFKDSVLPALGYTNSFSQTGYEADDIIAIICENLPGRDIIVVSTDQDLFQLLSDHVSIWNPVKKAILTKTSFVRKYGVGPSMWASVKALTGCKSDNIEGIPGVGERTAIKYLTGELKPTGRAFDQIVKGTKIWRRNEELVRLPYEGCRPVVFGQDEVTAQKWKAVLDYFGITSIRYS